MMIPFVGDAYAVLSPNLNCQTCINLYPVVDNRGGKTPMALYRTEGLRLFSDDNDTEYCARGLFELNNNLYGVVDDKFYKFDHLGARVEKGVLKTTIGRVSIISNGLQIGIFDGPNGYVYTFATDTFEQIDSENFKGCISATYQDGYGILPQPNTEIWYITDIFDFSTISALDFSSTNQSPDNLIASTSSHQELWFLNDNTTETWYDTGAAIFPFERRQTITVQYGCVSPFTLLTIDNSSLFWLARNKQSRALVVRLNGYAPQVISNEAVNYAISTYETIDDAFAFSYERNGHLFYVLTFPTADRTWVYDITTDMWHERRSTLNNEDPRSSDTRQGRWRANCYALFGGKHIVGDFESGKLYFLDPDIFDENGVEQIWERTTYHLADDQKWGTMNNLEVILQSGTGLVDGQGDDPQIMLQISKDYGHTFGQEKWRSSGKMGQYRRRVQWGAVGTARDWVFRIRGSDPVFQAIIGARADLKAGSY
jgi:hypothetical protein